MMADFPPSSQWLFIVDGSFTLLVSVIFAFCLPKSPNHTQPLVGFFNFFDDRERHVMRHRVILDEPNKKLALSSITPKDALKILATEWRLWGHCAINIVALVPKGGLQLYSPTIVKSLGFPTVQANALSSVSNYGVIVLALFAAWVSDKTRHRGLVCIAALAYSLIFAGVQFSLTINHNKWLKYAIFMLLNSGNAVGQGINDAWMASNARNAKTRALGLALCVIGSNLGGLSGQQLFQSQDAPKFVKGFMAVMCLYAAAIMLVVLVMLYYMWENRKMKRSEANGEQLTDGSGGFATKYDL